MQHRVIFLIISLLPFSSSLYAYNAYKCKDENGNVVFSQTKCLNTESEFLQVNPATGEKASQSSNKDLTERLNKASEIKASQNRPSNKRSVLSGSKSSSDAKAKNSSACKRYQSKIKRINKEMRSGYSPGRGEYLREKLQQAKNKVNEYCD